MPPEAVAMPRAHKVKQLEIGLKGRASASTLVFSSVDGNMLSPDNLSRDWCRVSAAKKLPRVSFHALVHPHLDADCRGWT